jgi:hypothetical protein
MTRLDFEGPDWPLWRKLFMQQMLFPSPDDMATPLGELSPMRLSWLFVGYSPAFGIFSGAMEVLAGLLSINRKIVSLRLITATDVFLRVAILNFSYDMPVKIFSIHRFLFSIFMLSYELKRLTNIIILNGLQSQTYTSTLNFKCYG